MTQPTHRGRASEMLASLEGKLPGAQAVLDAAQAHALLALADEVAALRAAIRDIADRRP
ncbi:hypothetical protein [Actinoplanes ianthinogenes]|nr:hypothetical protein [Actinoplanes ianthinogenes]